MSLVGTYEKPDGSMKLNITKADDGNGALSGSMEVVVDGTLYYLRVDGHYHFRNSSETPVQICLRAHVDNDKDKLGIYQGWSAYSESFSPAEIIMGGAANRMYTDGKVTIATFAFKAWKRI